MFFEINGNEMINSDHIDEVQLVGGEVYIKFANSAHDRILSFATAAEAQALYQEIRRKLRRE